MSKSVEDNFKVCGLCSQLVDESVEVSAGLRVFLIGFLGIDNVDLPTKVCLECYTHTVECKRFKDRCDKTLLKLQRSELYSSMILGRSAKDLAALKDMPLPIPPKASTSRFVEKNAADQVLEEAPPPRNSPPKAGPKPKPGKPGPASKAGKPGPASKIGKAATGPASKRNNELKSILDAQAPPEVRKLRSEVDVKPARRSESISSATSAVLDAPRSRRSLPTPNEKPAPPPKKATPATPASKKAAAAALKKEEPVPQARQTRGGQGSTPAATVATPSAKGGRRSTGGTSNRAHGLQPKVRVRRVERQRADREFERSGVQRSKFPLPSASPARGGKVGAKKRVAPPPEPEDEQPLQKRGRKSEKVVVPQETPKPTEELKSSFGRKRTPRTDKGYIYTDVATGNDIASPEDEKPLKKKKPGPASKAKKETPKASTKPVPKGRKSTVREELVFVEPTPQVDVEEESDDDDEEMFPSIGPYQCEICQNITDTKQEFVDHIKDNHRDIVDEEVLNSLERDLQKSRKKAAKEMRMSGKKGHPSPAKSGKSPASAAKDKKGPASKKGQTASVEKAKPKPGMKNSAATPAKGKTTPKKSGPVTEKKRSSLGNDNSATTPKKHEVMCDICGAMTKSAPSEIARHLKSRGCRAVAAEKKLAGGASAEAEIDPLDVDTSGTNGNNDSLGQTIDDIVGRTCQYCGKVVDDIKDLAGHYTTKGCVAKKYQMQNGVGDKSSATPVVIENAEDDDVDMGSVESEEQIVPNDIESDARADKQQNIGTSDDAGWGYAGDVSAQNGLSYGGHEAQPAFVDPMAYANNQSASVIVQSVVPDGFSPL